MKSCLAPVTRSQRHPKILSQSLNSSRNTSMTSSENESSKQSLHKGKKKNSVSSVSNIIQHNSKLKVKKHPKNRSNLTESEETVYLPNVGNSWNQEKLTTLYKPGELLGRKQEKREIGKFLNECLMDEINNKILYISGCPGVGKTATTREVFDKHASELNPNKVKFLYINALELKQPNGIYKRLFCELTGEKAPKRSHIEISSRVNSFLTDRKARKMNYFLLLDEVDYLYTKDEAVMYNLVDWASQDNNRSLSIVMVANTIDYPERLSAKINSRMGDHRICFRPYSKQQIEQIVHERLAGSKHFTAKAVSYMATKFSGYTSDLRVILSIIKEIVSKRKGSQVTIEEVIETWNFISKENHEEYKEEMPQYYKHVIEGIKKAGGRAHSLQLFRLLSQKNTSVQDIERTMKELSEMGIISFKQKAFEGYKGLEATLLKI